MYTVPDQSARRFVITGANSGTGLEATRRIAAAGGHVVMGVRSLDKGEKARTSILRENPGAHLEVLRVDLADLASVRDFAAGLLEQAQPISVLINNAGVMAPPHLMTTVDGFELQFGTNFLGPFALTNLLLPRLLTSLNPRVTTMSSVAAAFGRIRFADLQSRTRYSPFVAYGQSKLADLLMANHLADVATTRGWNLLSTSAHPGYTRTNLQTAGANLGRDVPRRRLLGDRTIVPSQNVEQGAEPLLYAATSPNAQQGAYYGPDGLLGMVGETKRVAVPRSARGIDLAQSLWTVAEDLTGTSLPA